MCKMTTPPVQRMRWLTSWLYVLGQSLRIGAGLELEFLMTCRVVDSK